MEHRKKRKTRKCKLKLGKTLAENAEGFGQTKAWFYLLAENAEKLCHVSHVLHGLGKLKLDWRTNTNGLTQGRFFHMNYHELSVNGWRGF